MSRICQVSGRKTQSGNNRPFSLKATRRTFRVNLIKRNIRMEDGTVVPVTISSREYKKLRRAGI